ncbi:hypothetical protein NDU88_001576 [Pleurodeles waltl]|uniref:Uncharacterized protein n=1 Tax=Pleurodeles waltl TaxID=8319 RepID=A0AAV7Q6A6_PLEWA|nr:hypothetical protein NDU88_001576 [Pleurodeles waltl]
MGISDGRRSSAHRALGGFRRAPAGLALGLLAASAALAPRSSLLPPRSRRGPPPCVLPHSLPQTSSTRAGCREAQIQLPGGLQWMQPQHSLGPARLPAGGFFLLLGLIRPLPVPGRAPSAKAATSSAFKLVKGFKKPDSFPSSSGFAYLGAASDKPAACPSKIVTSFAFAGHRPSLLMHPALLLPCTAFFFFSGTRILVPKHLPFLLPCALSFTSSAVTVSPSLALSFKCSAPGAPLSSQEWSLILLSTIGP